ncbi:MAG: asparagine--tRNA ligase [Deltaproteobacteria bacterium]|nr:asparagine--tRNA ligase [Deltaproteobacteria bacterium]
MIRIRIKDILDQPKLGQTVTVKGWLRTRRDSKGGFSFLEINDGSCLSNLQVVAGDGLPNYQEEVLRLTVGCALVITGELVASPAQGQSVELQAAGVIGLGGADPAKYPLQKKRHSFEFLRTIAHLRPRTNTFGAVARVRSALSGAIHNFFQNRGFVYIHTPIITTSDCEGAGQMFQVTTLDLKQPPMNAGQVDFSADFFGQAANLTVSGQLEAEIYALALGDVYTFGPTFRAENSNTSRHLSEFWMVEPECAFCDLAGDVDLAEEFLKAVFSHILQHCPEDMSFFNKLIDSTVIETLEKIIKSDFERISYTEAVEILTRSNENFAFPVGWGADLATEHERYLTEKWVKKPVVVTDYPKEIKPFYMRLNDDGRTVAAMDVLVPKIGEIIGGSQREERSQTLQDRMLEAGLSLDTYWWYLELREFGSAPHAGFGLGFDRLVQFVTGMANIRDVIPFPRTPKSAAF